MSDEEREKLLQEYEDLEEELYELNATGGDDILEDPEYQKKDKRAEELGKQLGYGEDDLGEN